MAATLILVFIFGTIIGSFLNVLIFRLPEEESINGRSHCRSCNHELGVADLVPVLSFLVLKGRCKYCKERVSWQYISVEVVTGLLFALAYYMAFRGVGIAPFDFGDFARVGLLPNLVFIRTIFIISVLIVIFSIDLKHFLILDKVLFPATVLLFLLDMGIMLSLKASFLESVPVGGLLSGLALFIFFGAIYYFSKGRWLGFGDVKFSWFLGLAVPGLLIFVNVFLAFGIGALVGIFLIAIKAKKLSSKIAFGTFLSVACLITMFWGKPILNWYIHLIGYAG